MATRYGSPTDHVHKERCMWHLLCPKINAREVSDETATLNRWKASKGKQGYALLSLGLSIISCDSLRFHPLGFLPEDWGMEARWRHAIKSTVLTFKLSIPYRVHRLPQRPRFLSLSTVRFLSTCPRTWLNVTGVPLKPSHACGSCFSPIYLTLLSSPAHL